MTVSLSEIPFIRYTTSASSFTIDFPRFNSNEIVVYAEQLSNGAVTLMTVGTDYTISDILPTSGQATLTLVDNSQAWISGGNLNGAAYALIIEYTTEPRQEVSFQNLGRFAPTKFEKVLDQLVMTVKAQQEVLGRMISLRRKDITDGADPELPELLSNRPDQIIGVNLTGDGLAYGHTFTEFQDLVTQVNNLAALVASLQGDSGIYQAIGFSTRFSETFNTLTLSDTIDQILQLGYVAPTVTFSASGSGTVREFGDTVASTTLTVNVTATIDPIARIEFFLNNTSTSIDLNAPPANTGTGTTQYVYSVPFNTNTTFIAQVEDDGTTVGGPSVTQLSDSFTFVYPYYYGVGAVGLTAAQVAALTKDIRTESNNYAVTFNAASGQVYYLAYPASYGTLSSVTDSFGFDNIGDWTLRVENITGLDGNPVSYNIYEFNNVVFSPAITYTFRQ